VSLHPGKISGIPPRKSRVLRRDSRFGLSRSQESGPAGSVAETIHHVPNVRPNWPRRHFDLRRRTAASPTPSLLSLSAGPYLPWNRCTGQLDNK
jgi:hypothetical protein